MTKIFLKTTVEMPFIDKESQEAFAAFIVSGGIGVFQEWLNKDCSPPINNLIEQFYGIFIKLGF